MIVNVNLRRVPLLYDAGNERSDRTGGWAAFAPAWASGGNPTGCVKNAASLEVSFTTPSSSDSWKNGGWATETLLDLSGYTKLHVRASAASSSGNTSHYHCFGVTSSKTPPTDGSDVPPGTYGALAVGDNELDVSALSSGYVYIGGSVRSHNSAGSCSIVVTKIWLT